jgi:predicted nucleotidyltransferase component of viral defense system
VTADRYLDQVALLVRVLPEVAREPDFALKGGTAINLFIRDLPRLSVDIDLTYLPVADREASLAAVHDGLDRIADHIEKRHGLKVDRQLLQDGKRLIISGDSAIVKIEVSPVLRGTVFDPEMRAVSAIVEERFGFVEMPLVSFADLYAGKMAAALDRQHPRDLFDIHYLLEQEGLSDELFQAFLVYLVSHPRPAHELLCPHLLDIAAQYDEQFVGMTVDIVTLDRLLDARQRLIEAVGQRARTVEVRDFLLRFHDLDPDFDMVGLPQTLAELPAVRWKLINLERLRRENPTKFVQQIEQLAACLATPASTIEGASA